MSVARLRAVVGVASILVISACDGGSNNGTNPEPAVDPAPPTLDVSSGNGQSGRVNTTLPTPLQVIATKSNGEPMVNATVTFAVTSGTATVAPTTAVTDGLGRAQTIVTLGATPGNVVVTATIAGPPVLTTTFVVVAGSGTITAACTAGAAQTPAVGAVISTIAGTGVCLGGGSTGAQYALVAFNSSKDSVILNPTTFSVRGSAVTGVTTADLAPLDARTSSDASPVRLANLVHRDFRAEFDRRLREMSIRSLTRRIPDAQRALRAAPSTPHFDVIPRSVSVGQVLKLNANGNSACDNPINIGARVMAISNTAILLADTANPTGSEAFTTADYQSFGTRFDTLVNPLDVDNFGQPSDIDKNGKVVILFTKEVNRLTPANNEDSFISGFFFERDLFPTTDNSQLGLQGCAGSNFGEMFYVLVPDPNGTQGPNGGAGVKHSKSDVMNNTIGTLAHEYQHLINAGRRLYVNNAPTFESVWLNEGLSHVAEELLYYRASKTAPRQNVGITQLRATVDAFNEYQSDNFGRFQVFLGKPSKTNPYGDNDSLQTRGATWFMLRYLADHHGTTDGDVWKSLVNTTAAGHHNLQLVFGNQYMDMIRDWSTSVYSDDLPGVSDVRFLEQSWNMRDIFPNLCANDACTVRLGIYPLQTSTLSSNVSAAQSVVPGGTAYIRFGVSANGQTSLDWFNGTLPVNPLMQFTIVRTQ